MRRQRPVAFDRDPKTRCVQRIDQRAVDLEHRLAPRQHDKALRAPLTPMMLDRAHERVGFGELASAKPVRPDEIGVAEAADRGRAILLRAPTTDCIR